MSKGALCEAVAAGCTTVGALKSATKASSTCGGCATLVKQILEAELKKRGVDVKNHLCQHFQYSRQELFHLIRVGNLSTFEAVIENTAPAWAATSASRPWLRSSPRAGTR